MNFTEDLIRRIEELQDITVGQINSKYQELNDKVSVDITSVDDMISVMEEDLQKLNQCQNTEEPQLFVDMKLGQFHETEGRELLQQVGLLRKDDFKFVLESDIHKFLKDLKSLGSFIEVYGDKLKGEYSITMRDERDSSIFGSCLLPDGTVMLTDWNNCRLKRLDASYRMTDFCDMPGEPWGVTCTAPDEVAVTIRDLNKVQFVSVRGSMSLTRSFNTTDHCRGICYNDGKLYVSCGGGPGDRPCCLEVCDQAGVILQTIKESSPRKQMLYWPYHVCVNPGSGNIHIADYKYGIMSFDRKGRFIRSVTDPALKGAWGECLLDNGHILVCGYKSNNVLQIDGDGKKITELLKPTDGIKRPQSLCYDGANSKLIVTMYNTNFVKIFDF